METAGFTVHHTAVDYEAGLDLERIIGGLLSAMPKSTSQIPSGATGFPAK